MRRLGNHRLRSRIGKPSSTSRPYARRRLSLGARTAALFTGAFAPTTQYGQVNRLVDRHCLFQLRRHKCDRMPQGIMTRRYNNQENKLMQEDRIPEASPRTVPIANLAEGKRDRTRLLSSHRG